MLGNVIVTSDDVRELAGIVANAGQELETQESKEERRAVSRAHFSFEMETSDGSTYESQTTDVFAKRGTLDGKQVTRLLMSFRGGQADASITVFIYHGNSEPFWNYVEVKGTDNTWVNGVTKKIEDVVAGWEKQAVWPRRFQDTILLVGAIGIGQLFLIGLDRLADFRHLHVLIRWAIQVFIGLGPAALVTRKLVELWPYIELRTGREHAQTLRKRKRYLWLLATVGVFPIIMRILYDGIKYFVHSGGKGP